MQNFTRQQINDRIHLTSSPGAVLTDIYTVPANKRALVRVVICNIANSGKTFRVAISPLGAAIANSHYIFYGKTIVGNDNIYDGEFELMATDVVRVYGSDANVSFTVNGIEYE